MRSTAPEVLAKIGSKIHSKIYGRSNALPQNFTIPLGVGVEGREDFPSNHCLWLRVSVQFRNFLANSWVLLLFWAVDFSPFPYKWTPYEVCTCIRGLPMAGVNGGVNTEKLQIASKDCWTFPFLKMPSVSSITLAPAPTPHHFNVTQVLSSLVPLPPFFAFLLNSKKCRFLLFSFAEYFSSF